MRANSIHQPVTHLLIGKRFPEIDETEFPKLISDIQKGDSAAKERAILSFVPIAIGFSRKFRQLHDARFDDVLSSGVLAIVEAIDTVEKEGLAHDNLAGYVRTRIFGGILSCPDQQPLVRIPRRSAERKGLPAFQLREDFDVSALEAAYPEIELTDLMDFIYRIAECRTDTEIIQARLAGLSDKQIGKQLGMSSATVWNRRCELAARLTEKLDVVYGN